MFTFIKEETLITIRRFATPLEFQNNPQYSGFDEVSGALFLGRPLGVYTPKYIFDHVGERYMVFRAKESRKNGEFRGNEEGQIRLVRLSVCELAETAHGPKIEEYPLYQIVSQTKPFFIERGRFAFSNGKKQVFGIWYAKASDILITY